MKRGTLLLCFGVASLVGSRSHAYCVARACDDDNPENACEYDFDGCPLTVSRPELFWPSKCVSFGFNQDASPKLGIDYDAANGSAERAVAHWLGAECGGGTPGVAVVNVGPIECGQVEYNQTGNANVFMFSDTSWPFGQPARTIALTIIQFSTETGEIFDADIAINSAHMLLSTEESSAGGFSLDAVLTHEVGHFLGLAHSGEPNAIMWADYANRGDQVRLDNDDVEGVCALHPPRADAASDDCSPRHGFASRCGGRLPTVSGGCALAANANGAPFLAPLGLALGLGLGRAWLSRRRRRQI
jgi:hypothetical protein